MKLPKLTSGQVCQWLYGVITAALPILVILSVIRPDDVAMWLALTAAVLGTGTASVRLAKQRRDGTLP